MHGVERVEGDEAVQEGLAEEGQRVATHRDHQASVGEHLGRGGTPGGRDPVAGQASQPRVLSFHGVDCKNSGCKRLRNLSTIQRI